MRQGILRYDSDLDTWCFDEEERLESVSPGEILRIRVADNFQCGQLYVNTDGKWEVIFGGARKSSQWALTLERGRWYPAKKD
ncbi:hypothetical protein EDD64_1591 [Effusibacillus lacus]|nr:hypothetical protein EDD64_1591 [Effusibacillus lacus]